MRSWRKLFVLGLVSLSALLLAACEVVGYNTPVVGAGGSAWSTIEAVDPVTGYTKTSVRTRAQSNSFFGKILSVFGRPSLIVSCVQAGTDRHLEVSIDWREAVGPPAARRNVQVRVEGQAAPGSPYSMLTSASGRISSLEGLGALVLIREMNHADRRTLAARVVNSGGNPVTLVFNIGGFDNVYPAVASTCS